MRKLISLWLVLVMIGMVGVLLIIPESSTAQDEPAITSCPFPEGYLDGALDDLTTVGEEIGQVNTADAGEVSLFYVRVYQLRHRYENEIPNLPDCALRGHVLLTNIFSNWEDILGLALAALANPEAADQYIAEIDVINQRIEFFTPLLIDELFPPVPPTPIPPTATDVPVLSVFYVDTEGLNVRSGPGGEFDSVGILTGGTAVDVVALDTLDNGDIWYQVLFEDGEDGTGWVFGGLLSPTVPEAFPEPLPTEALPTSTPEGDSEDDGGFEFDDTDSE